MRDFPSISNKITWTKQIERKLNVYKDRVKSVLGDEWDKYLEGRELQSLAEAFQAKLTSIQTHYYDSWVSEILAINVTEEKEKSVFEVEMRMNRYELALNFNQKLFSLFKEQANLKRLGFRPTLSVSLKSSDVQGLYPIATSIQESLRTFQYTNSKVTGRFAKLVAQVRSDVQNQLLEGL